MTFYLKPAQNSGVKKSRSQNPLLRRSSSSNPFASSKRTKAGAKDGKPAKPASSKQDLWDEELEDHGLVTALATDQRLCDVPQYVKYIRDRMFDDIPDKAGMNSTRIAEVLNFQKNMPPITTRAHVHALSKSPTATEREMADLVRAGIVRRLEIPGRGRGSQAVGDCLVLADEWLRMVHGSSGLDSDLQGKYVKVLHGSKGAMTAEALSFTQAEATALTQAGFLTNPSALNASVMLRPDSATLGSLTSLASIASRTVSGSHAAVGGAGAIHDVGGSGSSLGNAGNRASQPHSATMTFTIPSIGVFLRLLTAAREHLVFLLSRSKYRHAPLDILRERWDGAVDSAGSSKESTTVSRAIVPAKTKKWKQFHGLRFQWILEECLGAGLIEVFETGSVGLGVRLAS
ncbi:hypothetical protein FH972_021510 [Carpinus fangiana]|uniref:Serine-threonine protein kinase 19 n=1 Tax=Carpinus fangiana TaxID=176857 RepID=A0A5N6KPI7_9ROSI|nr:hypothetical protein FH972_021510 [Carpinus fangiana]